MADRKILIVEDNAIIAMETIERLKRLGYTVCGVAATGAEAIRIAGTAHPDLVLMDINLRGDMDGIEAAETIYAVRPVPIIYLTAYSDDETLARARGIRPLRYLVKPYKEVDLYTTIEEALRSQPVAEGPRVTAELQQFLERLDACPDGIIVLCTSGTVQYLNPRAREMTGWTNATANGRAMGDIVSTPAEGAGGGSADTAASLPCTITTPEGSHLPARMTWIRAGTGAAGDGPAIAIVWAEGRGRS
jgi:CheY-like chemotaxis protein